MLIRARQQTLLVVAIAFLVGVAGAKLSVPRSKVVPEKAIVGQGERVDPRNASPLKNLHSEPKDAVLEAATQNPDLLAAIAHILEKDDLEIGSLMITGTKSQEARFDELDPLCRLGRLVKALPENRMAELPALLMRYRSNELALAEILLAWSERTPMSAQAWVDAHLGFEEKARHAFMLGWARSDPAGAIAYADQLPMSVVGFQAQVALIEGMSETKPAEAFSLIKDRGWFARNPSAITKLLHNWGSLDPAGGLEALREVVHAIGLDSDPPPTLAEDLSKGSSLEAQNSEIANLISYLLKGAFKNNPDAAVALVGKLSSSERDTAAAEIEREVIERDLPHLIELGKTSPDDWICQMARAVFERKKAAKEERARERMGLDQSFKSGTSLPNDPFAPSPKTSDDLLAPPQPPPSPASNQ